MLADEPASSNDRRGGAVVGCAVQLAVAIGLTWAYRQFALAGPFEAPFDWIAAALAAIASTLGLACLADGFRHLRMEAALRRSDGPEEPSDGAFVAMIGTLHPLGEALRSPLRSRPCVAYDYQISSEQGERTCAEGRGLAPCVVRGRVAERRILDFPDLGSVDDEEASGGKSNVAGERARALVARIRRTRDDAEAPRGAEESDLDRPRFEDWIREPLTDEDLRALVLTESVLPVGAKARVYGTWSRARGGLVHGRGHGGRVWIGPPAVDGFARRVLPGLLLLVAVHAALYQPWVASRHARTERLGPALCRAVQRGSAKDVAALVKRTAVETRCTGGGTPLLRSPDARIARILLEAGADPEAIDDMGRTALHAAVIAGDIDRTRLLLEAGADVNRSAGSSGASPLWLAAGYQPEIAELLLSSGADDDRLDAATGVPLAGDGGAVLETCRRYVAAVHAADLVALRDLSTTEHEGRWGEPVIDTLAAPVPLRVERFVGYTTDGSATLTVHGPLGDGGEGWLTLQLVSWDTGWRVHRSSLGFSLEAEG
jgi:hypothetical protein